MSVAGISVVRERSVTCQFDAVRAEQRLIQRCVDACAERRAEEWFTGLDFEKVCGWMEQEAQRTPEHMSADGAPLGMMIRRDCYPFPQTGGYICRGCCRVHNARSPFICDVCAQRGFTFDGALLMAGQKVLLWSGIEPGTEVQAFNGVSCEELRPYEPWFRVHDPEWGYGRPMLDYGRVGAPAVTEPAKAA